MDIRQWLENTADREPPGRPDDISIPEKFRNDRQADDQVGQSYRYKKKRASSDSSIIAPKRTQYRKVPSPARSPAREHARQKDEAAQRQQDGESSEKSHSIHDAPSKTYEKRARHKTKADRYEPKAGKQKRKRNAHKDEKNSRKRRKLHRNDDGGRTTGLVQSFQLNNGPKNSRLTLKPDTSAGLFKHGRASVQIAGKGGGLPDLVFNEMRFLQKPTEHQDEAGRKHESQPTREKDRRPDQAEEISAYFNAKSGNHGEHPDKVDQRAKASELPSQRNASQQVDDVNPLINLPEKPFLGFGSRGAHPSNNHDRDDGASFYTWSESLQQPQHSQEARLVDHAHDEAKAPQSRAPKSLVVHKAHRDTIETANQRIDRGSWIRTGRSGHRALVEVYQPHNDADPDDKVRPPALQTTSQSLPRHPSSLPQIHQRRRSTVTSGAQTDHNYRTSDILKVHAAPLEPGDMYTHPLVYSQQTNHDKENQDPASSLSIDQAIKRATMAEQRSHLNPLSMARGPSAHVWSQSNAPKVSSANELPRIRQLSHPDQIQRRESPAEQRNFNVPNTPILAPSLNRSHPLSLAAREHWEEVALDAVTARTSRPTQNRRPAYINEIDNEVLDGIETRKPASIHNWHENSSSIAEHRFAPRSSIFEAQLHSASHRPTTSAYYRVDASRSGPLRGLSVENEMHRETTDVRQASAFDEGLAGFWKPNVLY